MPLREAVKQIVSPRGHPNSKVLGEGGAGGGATFFYRFRKLSGMFLLILMSLSKIIICQAFDV